MSGKNGSQHYNTPGTPVEEFPEPEARTRNTFWNKELSKLQEQPMVTFAYPGAKLSSGHSLRRKDYHVECVEKDDTLYLRYNPDAEAPKPRKARKATAKSASK